MSEFIKLYDNEIVPLIEQDRVKAKKTDVEYQLLIDKGLTYRRENGLSTWTDKGREYLIEHGHDPDKVTPHHWVRWILTSIEED
jgi:hypothetical protein